MSALEDLGRAVRAYPTLLRVGLAEAVAYRTPCPLCPLDTIPTGLDVALLARFPDRVAFDHLHGFHAGLAALAALDHALHGFERVVIHRVRTARADHQRFFDLAV